MGLRWLVAILATMGMFFAAWGALALGRVDPNITFSVAGLLSSVQGGFLFWWAGRETTPGRRLNPGRSTVVVGEIPQRPAAYQPRPDLYRRLIEPSNRPGVVIHTITGARGVGKTQLAAEFARHCIAEQWRLVAWINAEEPAQILSGLARLAEELDLRRPTDHAEGAARRVRRWLESEAPDRCLVVFDNAAQPDQFRHWLPAGGRAHIVVTSNDRAFESLGTIVDVGVFTMDEALAFLRERTGSDDEAGARLLAAEVGCLPIALAQSAAVIRRQALTFETFHSRLLELPIEEYLAPLPGDLYPHGAAHATLLSIEAAGRDHPLSRPLADFLAVLAPSGVTRRLLYAAARDGLLTGDDPATAVEVDEALGVLRESACLITFGLDGQAVIMHRFTQRVIRDRARRSGNLPGIVARAARLLTEALIPDGEGWARRVEGGELVQQITALCNAVGVCTLRDGSVRCELQHHGDRVSLLHNLLGLRRWAVRYLHEVADLAGALELGAATLTEHENLLGDDHPDTLEVADQLATAHQEAEEHERAVTLFERSFAGRERALPPGHPDIVASRHRLACAYQEVGRVAEAIPLYELVIADRERMFGSDHPQTLTSRNKLACALRDAGRYEESIGLYQQTLADRCRVLGPDDPATARTRGRLARVYQLTGRTQEAITLFERAVSDHTHGLGPDHPSTLEFRNELADAYGSAGRHVDAVALYRETLDLAVQALGGDHPLTQATRRRALTTSQHAPS